MRDFYWLLRFAAYGLVNANAKWQWHSDSTILNLGLKSVVHIPQLFYLQCNGELQLPVCKVVDDLLISG